MSAMTNPQGNDIQGGNMTNQEMNSKPQYAVPEGAWSLNSVFGNPDTAVMPMQAMQTRIPNMDSVFDSRNVWGANSPVSAFAQPNFNGQPPFKQNKT